MNHTQLLQHFDTLAETPDAVAKLRAFVLDLAVRGRLVPPSSGPEKNPAWLKFSREIAEQVHNTKSPSLFEIPDGWYWMVLDEIAEPCGQKKPDERFTYIDVGAIDNVRGVITPDLQILDADEAPSRARKLVRSNSVIYSTVRPNLRNIAVIEKDFEPPAIVSTAFAVLHPKPFLNSRYLFLWLRSAPFQENVAAKMKGVAYPAISDSELWQCPIPIPPPEEQRRIVAKVEELLALCDELEAAQTAAREHRTRLVRSALDHLTTAQTEPEFRQHATFFVREFQQFTATADFIPLLRSGMIEMGVTGALTGGTSKWEEVQLGKVADSRLGKMLDKAKNKGKPLPYLRNTNVQWFRFELTDVKKMLFEDDELDEFSLRKDDLLVCEGGEPGRCAVWDGQLPKMVFQKAIHRVRPNSKLLSEFLAYRLRADATSGRLEKHFTGATIKHFTGQELARYTFPLPPLAEQQRIVAKVDELMHWCDALEARLTAARTTATALLDATLHQILAG